MENSGVSVTRRRPFAKLHEKIQMKYNEMQKKFVRIDKSKSVDSLPSIDEDYLFKDHSRFASINDLRDAEDIFFDENFNEKHPASALNACHTISEDVNKQDVTSIDILCSEASVSEADSTSLMSASINEYDIFEESFVNISISSESLNELGKKCDENVVPSSPRSKLSIRNKIGSRIAAVKERRREERDKKKETRESAPRVEKFILSNSTKFDPRVLYKRIKVATVTIALIEVTGLENGPTEDKLRYLNCRFKLGIEKWRSKAVKTLTTEAKWQELFHMNLYDENNNMLEVNLFDKDLLIGRISLDLTLMKQEETYKMKMKLEGEMPTAEIFFLITITGTTGTLNSIIDAAKYNQNKFEDDPNRYIWYNFKGLTEVGCLSVLVHGAKGLSAYDCFCNLRLDNERRQTNTEYKTIDPHWMKYFTFKVTDITSILEITVIDERKDEEVGVASIPLLKIKNGIKVWYALKDNTQRERAKGNNPRILLEMRISWNLIKASTRVITPREVDYLRVEDKFDRRLFFKNLARARPVVNWTLGAFRVIKTCFEWESRKWNTIALIAWLLFNWFFRAWMVPLLLLIPFALYRPEEYYIIHWRNLLQINNQEDNITDEDAKVKDEKLSLRQKVNNFQAMIQTVQNFIGKGACLGERVKNLCNFSVPYLSFFTIFAILLIAFIMFLIPAQYIFMGWGIHKYTRKILRPNRIPNSEILDLLSRVPDDEVLLDCEELSLETTSKDDDTI